MVKLVVAEYLRLFPVRRMTLRLGTYYTRYQYASMYSLLLGWKLRV